MADKKLHFCPILVKRHTIFPRAFIIIGISGQCNLILTDSVWLHFLHPLVPTAQVLYDGRTVCVQKEKESLGLLAEGRKDAAAAAAAVFFCLKSPNNHKQSSSEPVLVSCSLAFRRRMKH